MTLYWLAGILEGEGSFLSGPPSSPDCPAIRLPMTDQDVVVRVADLFRRAVIPTKARRSHHKTAYVTTIKGAGAARMMAGLAPLMSRRRNKQIERALLRHRAHPKWRSARSTCVVFGCERRARTKGLCKQHYHQWWKSKRFGRVPRVTPIDEELVTDGAALAWETADPSARLAWLAGLLEGEGSFLAAHFGPHAYPRIRVTMCDLEVLERARDLMTGSHIYDADDRGTESHGWSKAWVLTQNGAPAAETMKALRGWMGQRRGRAIDYVLSVWKPIRLVQPPTTCVVAGCARLHSARGLCNAHYMSWSRDLAKGRTPRVTPLR